MEPSTFYPRSLPLSSLLNEKSHFLFGPRSTGKSWWIRRSLPDALYFNLLDRELFMEWRLRPSGLRHHLNAVFDTLAPDTPMPWVVIDEIQKVPALLDEVHWMIEEKGVVFLLTGSSARSLRRGGANLLAGRAFWREFFPLTYAEIENGGAPGFDLLRYCSRGGLPQVWTSKNPTKELQAYVDLYLKEEIREEGHTRKLDQFLRFFESLGSMNGREINLQGWSSDIGVPRKTLESYIELMEDTLVAFRLPAFRKTSKRRAIARAKFYLFDVGIAAHLLGRTQIKERTPAFGDAFEHFMIQELRALNSLQERNWSFTYWRSQSGFEVDLCLDQSWAIEFKAKSSVGNQDLKGLKALQQEKLFERYAVVCLEPLKRRTSDAIEIWPWQSFLNMMWE